MFVTVSWRSGGHVRVYGFIPPPPFPGRNTVCSCSFCESVCCSVVFEKCVCIKLQPYLCYLAHRRRDEQLQKSRWVEDGEERKVEGRSAGGHSKKLVRIAAHSGGCTLHTRATFSRKCDGIKAHIGSKMRICKSSQAAQIYKDNMQKP